MSPPRSLAFLLLLLIPICSGHPDRAAERLSDIVQMPEVRPLIDWAVGVRSGDIGEVRGPVDLLVCTLCVDVLSGLVQGWEDGEYTLEEMNENLKDICTDLEILSENGCNGIIDNYAPILEYVYFTEGVPMTTFCATVLGETDCGAVATLEQWEVDVDQNYPPVEEPTMPDPDQPTQKVLHLSDFHVDLTYTPGSYITCLDDMCCTNSSGMAPEGSDDAAGYWGEYVCDLPTWTAEHMMEQISQEHQDLDFILLTGDYPAHDLYYQSRDYNLQSASETVDIVRSAFPGVTILPSMGNHEAFPGNSFPTDSVPSEFDPSWLYDGLADIYSEWLDADAEETFRAGGYYTMEIGEGFRLIGINSLFGYNLNFWLGYHYQDANGQLQWLHDTLLEAEAAGERVWILGHMPPGHNNCLGAWGREYNRIVERFENTIANQFLGHTHKDHFKMFYDTLTVLRPTAFAFVTPSVTPHTNVNLAYRVYTIDGDYEGSTRRVVDYDSYAGDLSQAGDETEPPVYSRLYNAKEDLGLANLLPEDYDQLVRKLRDDDDFFDTYYSYYYSGSVMAGSPSDADRRDVICRAVTTNYDDQAKCDDVMNGM